MAYYFQLLPTTQPTQLRITTSCSPTSGATHRTSPAVRSAITTPSSPSRATCCPTSSPPLRPPMAGAATSTAATCASRSVSEYHSPSRPPSDLLLTYALNCAPVHLPTCPPTRSTCAPRPGCCCCCCCSCCPPRRSSRAERYGYERARRRRWASVCVIQCRQCTSLAGRTLPVESAAVARSEPSFVCVWRMVNTYSRVFTRGLNTCINTCICMTPNLT